MEELVNVCEKLTGIILIMEGWKHATSEYFD